MKELDKNAANHGVNITSFSAGSIFTMQEHLLKMVGYGTYGMISRAAYGLGASVVMGKGENGAIVGSVGGLAVGMLVTAGAVALLGGSTPILIGAAVAGGLGSTAGGVFFQSLYDAYDKYSTGRDSVPKKDSFLPSDADDYDFDSGTVLPPIII